MFLGLLKEKLTKGVQQGQNSPVFPQVKARMQTWCRLWRWTADWKEGFEEDGGREGCGGVWWIDSQSQVGVLVGMLRISN